MSDALQRIQALEAMKRQQEAHAEVDRLAVLTGIPTEEIHAEAERITALAQVTGKDPIVLMAEEAGIRVEEVRVEADRLLGEGPC